MELPWDKAFALAGEAAVPLPAVTRPLGAAAGHALAAPLTALTGLPAFNTAAMDGWAVSGPGPWLELADGILAGEVPPPLRPGTARRIATGAHVPDGASAVLRLEDGVIDDGTLTSVLPLPGGKHIRLRGQECTEGEVLLQAGATVTPPVLALAAAAGHDQLPVRRRPLVQVLVTGGELTRSGVPRDGRVRDALSPLLLPWLTQCGAQVQAPGAVLLGDDAGALRARLRDPVPDVILTTGSTSAGSTDVLHDVLRDCGAQLRVDGVAVRPGHPMLLAQLPAGRAGSPRWLVGLPGNPLAAVAGLVTLAMPLLRRLGGHRAPPARFLTAAQDMPGHPRHTRLVPVATDGVRAVPLPFDGPAMLRGVALADALAVVLPGGAPAGASVQVLPLGC